jgi:uncharacterized protein (TIGR00369 family)
MPTERTRTIQWDDPALTAGAAKGKTGLAFLRGILEGLTPVAPIQKTLGFELVAAEEGLARFRSMPGEHMYNPMGGVHGGVACTLLDSAMGCAVMTTCDEKTGYTTVELSMHLTRPITLKSGPITAEGRILNRGSRLVTVEARLTDEQDRLLAHATSTCLLMQRP